MRETDGGERGGQGCQHDHQLLHCQGKYAQGGEMESVSRVNVQGGCVATLGMPLRWLKYSASWFL